MIVLTDKAICLLKDYVDDVNDAMTSESIIRAADRLSGLLDGILALTEEYDADKQP